MWTSFRNGIRTLKGIFVSGCHLLAHFKGGDTEAQRSLSQLALLSPLHQTTELPLATQTYPSQAEGD